VYQLITRRYRGVHASTREESLPERIDRSPEERGGTLLDTFPRRPVELVAPSKRPASR